MMWGRSRQTLEQAPDLAAAITAWRVWRLASVGERYRLASLYKWAVWEPGEPLKAECQGSSSFLGKLLGRCDHPAPFTECACGIHGGDLDLVCSSLQAFGRDVEIVVGEVSLWGDVVECERGFRSSFAYPLHLYVSGRAHSTVGDDDVVAALAVYRVPVEVLPVALADAGAELLRRSGGIAAL